MKILVATGIFPPEIGGPSTYASLLVEELPKRGIQVDVLPFRTVRKYPRVFRHMVYAIKVFFKSLKVDIIFTQDPVSTGIPVIVAAFFSRRKVVLRVAGDYAWEQASQRFGVKDSIDEFQSKKYNFFTELLRYLQRLTIRHVDFVITPSEYFNRLVSGWNNNKIKVVTIYNGIDLNFNFIKEEKFLDNTIISAGRLVPWKGFDLLIESLAEMPDWNVIIVGDGPDKLRLQGLIKNMDLEKRVKMLGNIPREELLKKISQSKIFALLSTFESFSFQIVEAMYSGAPVIAGNIGNISEIIENGKDGILIDPTDKDQFVSAVERLSADPVLRDALVSKARLKAQEFSFNKTIDRLEAIFKDIA